MDLRIKLHEAMFAADVRLLARWGRITVRAFRYASGVAALEIETATGRVVLLPFQGQQIWRAQFLGRDLTMHSVFDAPLPTRAFRRTYGAFFLHCGATAMGTPAPGEDHLPHGELPNIPFDSAELVFGQDGTRPFVDLTGVAHDREAFSHAFRFKPRLRFYETGAVIDAEVELKNTGGAEMPLMYLAHVNFRPVAGGQIIDGMADDTDWKWQQPVLDDAVPEAVRSWHNAVGADRARHRTIVDADRVEPEFCTTMTLPTAADGRAHALQLLPDGTADIVRYRTRELPFAVRWITRAPERQALGFALPATAAPNGRAAAKRAGHLMSLKPQETYRAAFGFGVLDAAEAAAMLAALKQG